MNNPESFESKIREKLDKNSVDYQESYWKAYDQTYPLQWYQKIRFSWKSHAIFAYSLLSFALGYIWNSGVFKKSPASVIPTISNSDTLFIVKEIIHKDTVFMYPQNIVKVKDANQNEEAGIATSTMSVTDNTSNNESPTLNEHSDESSNSPNNTVVKATFSDHSVALQKSIDAIDQSTKLQGTSNGNALLNTTDSHSALAAAEASPSGSRRSLVSPESEENNFFDTIDNNNQAELAINKPDEAIENRLKDTVIVEISDAFNSRDDESKSVDSSFLEDPEIVKMNLKKPYWEWGFGASTLIFLPMEQGEVSYNSGIFGGVDIHGRMNRWSVQAGLLYGASFVEIDNVDQVDISVSHEFAGFKNLNSTPEDVKMVTQAMAPHFNIEYALLNKAKYGMGISAGILGILPVERLFIYDYSWQSQVRTRESQPGMDPFKLMPNAGMSVWYQPRYDWQVQLGAKLYPTMIKGKMHEANAVAPISIQVGVLKYW